MITRNSTPKNYIPFNTLIICSNTLSGGGNLVAVGDVLPLLIGKGEIPKIWLQALADSKKNQFITIVEESISKHPAVKVYEESGSLNVLISEEIVLSVKILNQDTAVVEKLDFRPIGLNMHGDLSSLTAGGGTFSGNSMSGGGTLIGLGL
ncbi:MAG: hypothetical protein OEZ41_00975 [Nitrospirota bacterium]|nr:hypothetical protein [Nitrospirota bacterium]MDH5698520.1 hypothetical protein [Nitrospirota bacterium]